MTKILQGDLWNNFEQQTQSNENQGFEKNTLELKQLIKQADSSGIAAWEAGKILKLVKEKKEYTLKYQSFSAYVSAEFKIVESTATTYIKIHEQFTIQEISDLIVSNLKVIADIKNIELRKEVVKAFSSQNSEDYKVKDVIAIIALLDEGKKDYNQEEIDLVVKKEIQKATVEKYKEKEKRSGLDKYGEPIKSEAFPELDWMTTAAFEFDKNTLYFKTIKFVKTSFPDACIICKVEGKKNSNVDLNIEFEYQSHNFLKHGHHKCKKKCHLIVCWEDNIRSDKDRAKVKNLPPIIELNNFLETGKINLK